MTREEDYGLPTIRVRRLPDRKGLLGKRRRYEVEITPVGAPGPASVSEVNDPVGQLRDIVGFGDAHAIVQAADEAWDGGIGEWRGLFSGESG